MFICLEWSSSRLTGFSKETVTHCFQLSWMSSMSKLYRYETTFLIDKQKWFSPSVYISLPGTKFPSFQVISQWISQYFFTEKGLLELTSQPQLLHVVNGKFSLNCISIFAGNIAQNARERAKHFINARRWGKI